MVNYSTTAVSRLLTSETDDVHLLFFCHANRLPVIFFRSSLTGFGLIGYARHDSNKQGTIHCMSTCGTDEITASSRSSVPLR